MRIVPLKCPNCGAEIQLDFEREIGFCMYCGGKVMIQDIMNKSIKIDESGKIENWITLGFDALRQNNLEDVEIYANKIIETDLNNPSGWYFKGCISKGNIQHSIYCWSKAVSFSNNDKRIKELATNALNNPEKYIVKKQKTIQFVRQKHLAGSLFQARIFIDNNEILNVGNGEMKSINLNEGNYTLIVKFGMIKTVIPLIVDRNILINMDIDKKTNTFQVTQNK